MIHHNGDGEKSKKYSETTRFESVAMNDSNESLVGGHVTSFEIDQTIFEVENLVEKPHGRVKYVKYIGNKAVWCYY